MKKLSVTQWLTRKVVAVISVCAGLCACASLQEPGDSGRPQAATAELDSRQRLALLVGISEYPQTGPAPWKRLHAHRDLTELSDVLKARYRFRDEDLLLLEDQAATAAGIRAAFRSHLIEKVRPGAVVVFHFSGHGQQVRDDNADELDGLDETLVPVESNDQRASSGARVNLRDDEIGQWLTDLQAKMRGPSGRVEGSINVFLDSCHSGTATRGDLIERGRGWDEDPAMDGQRPQISARESSIALSMSDKGGEYVLMSAAQSDQTAKEMAGMGIFTHALVGALRRAHAGTTYRALLDDVVTQVHGRVRNQTPQLEGTLDKYLFAGAAPPSIPYARVEWVSGDEIEIGSGELHLVSIGSLYDLHRPGTAVPDPATRLGQAEVISVEAARSRLRLRSEPGSRRPTTAELRGARAIEVVHSYRDRKLHVMLDGPVEPSLAQSVRSLPLVDIQSVTKDSYDVKLTQTGSHIEIRRPESGCVLSRVAVTSRPPNAVLTELVHHLQNEWRWRQLYRLSQDNPDVRAEVRILPGTAILNARGYATSISMRSEAQPPGPPRLKEHEHFTLEIKNPTPFPICVTVLELKPGGQLDVLFPKAGQLQDTFIKPGTTVLRHGYIFQVERPFGPYVYKVIATRHPLDLYSLIQHANQLSLSTPGVRAAGLATLATQTRGTPSQINPLLQLLFAATAGAQRGSNTSLPLSAWSVTETHMEVTSSPIESQPRKDTCEQ